MSLLLLVISGDGQEIIGDWEWKNPLFRDGVVLERVTRVGHEEEVGVTQGEGIGFEVGCDNLLRREVVSLSCRGRDCVSG